MNNLFKEHSKKVRIFFTKSVINDPYEKSTTETNMGFCVIPSIISDLTVAKVQWAMPGIVTSKAKEIIIRKKDRPMLEMSQKIQIVGDTDYYEGWKQNSKMQIREEGNFCRCYIYIKKV